VKYQLLGRSGLRVSELALGTMTFGAELGWGADRDECRRIFDAYVESGGNHIDTANEIYTGGTSESLVGEFVGYERDRFVIGTKYTDAFPGVDTNFAGNGRKSMVRSLERSLKRLGTDHVDVFWVHAWDYTTPVEEVMRGLDDLVRSGKVLYVGISDAPAWVVAHTNALAAERGWVQFVAQQVEYSLIEHTADRELVPVAEHFGMTTMGYSALASGLLSGKYSSQSRHAETGARRLDTAAFVEQNPRNLAIADEVIAVADAIDRRPSQVALNWVRQRGVMPIVGATKVSQVKDNLAALEFELSPEHLARLDAAAQVAMGFPHEFLARTRAVVYGGHFDAIDFPFKRHLPL
jgi:aryl-alcohol dehydrogenase-like predicted oxidoreductase